MVMLKIFLNCYAQRHFIVPWSSGENTYIIKDISILDYLVNCVTDANLPPNLRTVFSKLISFTDIQDRVSIACQRLHTK